MNSQLQRWPLFLRCAFLASATGVVGAVVWAFGGPLVRSPGNAELRDTMPMIGSTLMSVCAMMFLFAAVFAVANAARERKITWSHGLVILVAGAVTIAAGIDGAYPR
ncbi:hypothetical protein [Planctomycetes bacterium K23_9]|uniref:hypothetical protein n=1 Tax=Stieleria marina TaxID=1930275 RepID=UPI0011A3C645